MHLSFSKMNPGTTVQFAASRGPQNEVHPSLRCPWEPATPQCEDNHHLTQWGKAQLFVCLCNRAYSCSFCSSCWLLLQLVTLGVFPFAVRSLTCLKGSFLPLFALLSSFYITSVTPF